MSVEFQEEIVGDEQVDEEQSLMPLLSSDVQPREVFVKEFEASDDSSTPGSSEDEETAVPPKYDIPQEYWHIQKLIKYMKVGNQTATVVALSCLQDHNLTTYLNQTAVQDIGGVEVMINLLETKNLQCRLAAANILVRMAVTTEIRRCIVNLGGVSVLVDKLADPARDLQTFAAEILYNIGHIRKARKHVRKYKGINRLVELLDVNDIYLQTPKERLGPDWEFVELAQAVARALCSASKSRRNIQVMMACGAVPILARLLRSIHIEVIVPAVGIIACCANDPNYQLAFRTENMIKDIVKQLSAEEYPDSRQFCAETIFKCCEEPLTRSLVRQAGGLDPLITMLKDESLRSNKNLLAAVTGAIWKTAKSSENVKRFDQLRTVETLVKLLDNVEEDERVLSNVTGALYECLKFEDNRYILRRTGGIPYLITLLNYTYPPLLENLPLVLSECAEDADSMRIIEKLDGVRLIWSLLKNESPQVQANAAWSLVNCVHYAHDSGEMVRCFVGGLEILVYLLKSKNKQVLACACAAIAEVAKDTENLAVMTDYGVVPMLANLVHTDQPLLRQHLASAIASCCHWKANCKYFGHLGVCTPLVHYMKTCNVDIQRTTALALFHLSYNSFNCITMHESGVVPFLLKSIGSSNWELQESAAGCLANIRKLALEAETTYLVRNQIDDDDDDEEEENTNVVAK